MAETENALGPDLVFGGLTVDLIGPTDSGEMRFTGTVVNVGARNADASDVAMFLSDDQVIDQDDLLLNIIPLAGIMPGHLIDFSGAVLLPDMPLAEGPFFIVAGADYGNDIVEAGEENNLGFVELPRQLMTDDRDPTMNIEPFVLVLRADAGIADTGDLPAFWRLAENLPNPQYLEAMRELTAAGMGAFSTLQMDENAAVDALARGDVTGVLLPRDSALLAPVADGFVAYEMPSKAGVLHPFNPEITLVRAPDIGAPFASSTSDEVLLGTEGTDTVHYEGALSSFTLTLTPNTMTILDRREDGQGLDTLVSIEQLQFDGGEETGQGQDLNLALFTGPTTLTQQEFAAITELYIAYFNRAPDALGLFYWGTEFANGFTIQQIATSFFMQPETLSTYAHVFDSQGKLANTDAFVEAVYANVLGRAPDAEGFAYWVNELDHNPLITAPIFILSVIGGAKFPSNPTPQTQADQEYLANKVNIGAYYSAIKGMSDTQDAKDVMSLFDGTQDSVTAARDAVDALYLDASDPDAGAFLFQLVGVLDDPFLLV